MLLRDWMRVEGVSDAAMAERIGDISAEMVRKLRFRASGTSLRVAGRIDLITGGQVRAADLVPSKSPSRRTAPAVAEACP